MTKFERLVLKLLLMIARAQTYPTAMWDIYYKTIEDTTDYLCTQTIEDTTDYLCGEENE
jgi:hypothetical protein